MGPALPPKRHAICGTGEGDGAAPGEGDGLSDGLAVTAVLGEGERTANALEGPGVHAPRHNTNVAKQASLPILEG
jgi:hypothetical protein